MSEDEIETILRAAGAEYRHTGRGVNAWCMDGDLMPLINALLAAPVMPLKYELHLPDGDSRTARVVFSERKGNTVELCVALSDTAPVAPAGPVIAVECWKCGAKTFDRAPVAPADRKAARVHELVNAGPFPGMSEAFDQFIGSAAWTDPAWRSESSVWAAAWRAAKAAPVAPAEPDEMLPHLIYAAIAHEGKLLTVADFKAAAARVVDVLARRASSAAPVAPAEPVIAVECWKCGAKTFDRGAHRRQGAAMGYTNPGYDPARWIERTSEPVCDHCNDSEDGCDECDPPESEGGETD